MAKARARRSEARLREERDFSDALIASLPDIFYLAEPSGKLVRWNVRLEEASGYTAEEIREMHALDFAPEEDRDALASAMAEALERGSITLETRLLTKSGVTVPHVITGTRFVVNGETYLLGTASDVSERIQAERALRENEARLDFALKAAGIGAWDWHIETGEVSWSEGWAQLYGVDEGGFNGAQDKFLALIHPDDRASVAGAIRRALEDDQDYTVEHRVLRPDGSLRWIISLGDVARDAAGRAVRMSGVALDITERRETREALAREREFLRAMLDNIADGIVACNAGGVLTSFNKAAEDFHGLPLAALTPERWAEHYGLYHPDGKTRMNPEEVPLFRALMGERVRDSEMVIAPKEGEARTVVASGQALYDQGGKKLGAVVAMHDVTGSKRAEHALKESEARFRAMADTAPVFIWLVEPETGATYFNKRWLEFTGRTLEQEQGEGWLESVHPDDRERAIRTADAAVAARREYEMEYRLRRADGVYRWLTDRGVPRHLPDGSYAGFIGSCTDITERKEAEERLRQSEERYRTLFGSIDEGFCVLEMLFDDADRPVDYRFVEVNPAFERMTGLREAVGRTARELVPDLEPWWVETYGRVALTGEATRFENRSPAMNRWFDVYASRVGGEESRKVALVFTDISRRKEDEEELRRQHELMRAITDNAASGLFMMDRRGHPTFMNPAAERITGYTLGEIKDVPLHYAVHHSHPDGRPYPMEDCPIDRASAELVPIRHHEDIFVRKDGTFFPVVAHISPLEQGGETVGAVIEFRDVSELKRAEAERFRLADHLHLLLESTSEGIFGIGAEGRCTFINRAGAKLLGYRTDEIIGKNVHRLIHHSRADGSAYPEEACPIYTTMRSGQSVSVEDDTFWRRDGTALPVEYSAAPIRAGDAIQGAVITFSDITARKQAALERDELLGRERQSRILAEIASRRLSFLAEASTVLASSLDYETTLQSVARLAVPEIADWCAIDILSQGELKRLALQHVDSDKAAFGRELQRRYPPDLTAEHGIAHVLRTGETAFFPEIPDEVLEAAARDAEHLEILRKVGMRSALMVPLKVRGKTIGAITLVLSESERRYEASDLELAEELARRASVAVDNARLFEETQELNESLEQRVALRTEQLEQINQELEAFAYAVSHDLRTPLSGIDGFSQALVEDYGDNLDETASYYLERIQFNTRRMGRLIDDILKLSRVSRHALRLDQVDLSELASAVAENLRGRYADSQPDFRCEPGLTVEGDEGLLRIAVENLLDNAWKFSSLNDQAHVAFGRTESDGELVYFVRDTGAGFDMVYVHQLFQPFHRLHTEASFKGTGIGLVTVKRIIERHGGRIWAEAEPDKGATFFFTLNAGKMVERA